RRFKNHAICAVEIFLPGQSIVFGRTDEIVGRSLYIRPPVSLTIAPPEVRHIKEHRDLLDVAEASILLASAADVRVLQAFFSIPDPNARAVWLRARRAFQRFLGQSTVIKSKLITLDPPARPGR